ncbi:MAG TPA: type II secretion system protein, partial [Candidatus Hydrogenedentes bacterium]|nr:type II secretion system protein [Candidatus Hydrogenedentota bacterium]
MHRCVGMRRDWRETCTLSTGHYRWKDRTMTNKRRHNAGMTLLELMFASGIIAVALSVLFGGLISVSMIGRLNESRMAAAVALSGVMDELNTLPLTMIAKYVPPPIEVPFHEYSLAVECLIPSTDESGEAVVQAVALPLDESAGIT